MDENKKRQFINEVLDICIAHGVDVEIECCNDMISCRKYDEYFEPIFDITTEFYTTASPYDIEYNEFIPTLKRLINENS